MKKLTPCLLAASSEIKPNLSEIDRFVELHIAKTSQMFSESLLEIGKIQAKCIAKQIDGNSKMHSEKVCEFALISVNKMGGRNG